MRSYTIEDYVRLVERHRELAKTPNVGVAEHELWRERLVAADEIASDEEELARLPEFPEIMQTFVADRQRARGEIDTNYYTKRAEDLLFGPDVKLDDEERRFLKNNSVAGYMHARARSLELLRNGAHAEDFHAVRAVEMDLANRIVRVPPSLVSLGFGNPELAEIVFAQTGTDWTEEAQARARELAQAWLDADRAVREAAGERRYVDALEARANRIEATGAMMLEPSSFFELGRAGALENRILAGKIQADVADRLIDRTISEREQRDYEKRVRAFDERAGVGEHDLPTRYRAIQEAIWQRELSDVDTRPLLHLRRLSRETAQKIDADPEIHRRFAAEAPELVDLLGREVRRDPVRANAADARAEAQGAAIAPDEQARAAGAAAEAAARRRERRNVAEPIWDIVARNAPAREAQLRAHLADPETEFMGLGLNRFLGSGAIPRELSKLPEERVVALYDGTVAMMRRIRSTDDHNNEMGRIAHDQLEMGRRWLGEILVRRHGRDRDAIDNDAQPLRSLPGRALDPALAMDPGHFINNGEREKRRAMAELIERRRRMRADQLRAVHDAVQGSARKWSKIVNDFVFAR